MPLIFWHSLGNQRERSVPGVPMSEQLTLTLTPSLTVQHSSLKECVAAGVYRRGVVGVAGKINRQPSHLSEALSGHDRRKFDLDDLEAYIEKTGDTDPVLYLVQKFMRDPKVVQQEALERLVTIAEQLPGMLAQAGFGKARR